MVAALTRDRHATGPIAQTLCAGDGNGSGLTNVEGGIRLMEPAVVTHPHLPRMRLAHAPGSPPPPGTPQRALTRVPEPAAGPTATVTWVPSSDHGSEPRPPKRLDLREGERFDFGRDPSTGAFKSGVQPVLGSIEVEGGRLVVSNYTASTTFAIENLEGGTELVKARPRHVRMTVPFEMFRILIPAGLTMLELTAFGPEPPMLHADHATENADSAIPQLDTASKYFAVLVALCEPRLRGNSMAAVPSVQELVARLRETELFKLANRSSINYHIDYLVDQKIPVTQWAKYGDQGRRHSKREALVAFALRFDLVGEHHLDLLRTGIADLRARSVARG